MSTFPDRYREVSVTDVDVPLELEPLRALLTSRPVYRRSRYVVVRRGAETALVEVIRGATSGLFSAVEDVVLLASPAETVYLHRPELDTGVPSNLVRAAQAAPDARCVVVEGSYGHVSFVLDPDPVRLHVLDVAPPWPAKLLDQVERVLETADDLTGVLPVPHVVELPDLLPGEPTGHYLLPCRGGGMDVPGAEVSYLDEVPPKADWTLLGCARSRAIHDFFYEGPVRQVDTCPRTLAAGVELPPGEVLLTKCCLLENHVEVDGRVVITPWGASFGHLREALEAAAELAEQA
ncbi:DUF7714 family protein [Geodermatophilus ruber]|uniref:Uncharacterized protein n=1 Tax=Geodermatophilus ruber TaxID=504800 RepID=A0A1I4BL51_9ACTN|nr:hypothetical protein [Geodermatophilus ruber]SFK69273.1 hypothetical protein SAMN04488085_10385 [Geodermatophilus ruber]